MRKIRDVVRLRWAGGLSQRAIGRSIGLSQGAVFAYLERARWAGLGWPLPDDLDDDRLEALLFPPPPDIPATRRPPPDWAEIHRELRKPGVTLALLWEEYRAEHPTLEAWRRTIWRDLRTRIRETGPPNSDGEHWV